MNNTVSAEAVETARLRMTEAHDVFSQAHYKTEDAQDALKLVALHLAELVKRRRVAARSIEALTRAAVEALTVNFKEKIAAPGMLAARQEESILGLAIESFQREKHCAVEREHLVAVLRETEAQLSFEESRLNHHRAQLQVLLGSAAELDGGLELSGDGAVSAQLKEIIGDLYGKVSRARQTLQEFDGRVAAARAQQQGVFNG